MRYFSRLLALGISGLAVAGCNDYVACEGSALFEDVVLEWEWSANDMATPAMVADVDGDGSTDVVVQAARVGIYHNGEIVLLDGRTGKEKWRIGHDPLADRFGSQGRATVALADVSGDGLPDIIYAGRGDDEMNLGKSSPLHAVDGFGELLWTSHLPNGQLATLSADNGAIAVANLDDDPEAEVVIGAAVLDHDGTLVWSQDGDGGAIGAPLRLTGSRAGQVVYPGGLSTLADLDGDGRPEIVSGRDAWTIDWSGGPEAVTLTRRWRNSAGEGNDGFPAIADLDGNGTPEVVLTAMPEIRIIDGDTGRLWCGADPSGATCEKEPGKRTRPLDVAGGGIGGPASIADFDGDGRPEIAVAGGNSVAVYDFNRPGEDLGGREVAPGAMFVRWSVDAEDRSSSSTATSAYDFDGDGIVEVLYSDECELRVLDGATGRVLMSRPNSSGTTHEYPVVADVDDDSQPEILIFSSITGEEPVTNCTHVEGSLVRMGLYVYGTDGKDRWVPSRSVWTQHTQHGTDVDAAGKLPHDEQDHWLVNNSFRQALPAEGAAAPAAEGSEVCR
jgi:hypothetical protein